MIISSRNNQSIKTIRGLRNRKEREETGLFFVEGIRIVAEAAQVGAPIEEIVVAPTLLTSQFAQEIVDAQRRAGIPCLEVTADVFKSISMKEHPQGLGAIVRQRWEALNELHLGNELCWIVLSGVQDPGNLGTILRTGDAVGSKGVILVGHTTDPYDPDAVRASMGAIFSQQVVRANLDQVVAWKQARQSAIVGTSDAADVDYHAVAYETPLLLFMGSEQHGLSSEEEAVCDIIVRIPMVGRSDSLNLSVATAVVLYEIFNQYRTSSRYNR